MVAWTRYHSMALVLAVIAQYVLTSPVFMEPLHEAARPMRDWGSRVYNSLSSWDRLERMLERWRREGPRSVAEASQHIATLEQAICKLES